MSTWKVRHEGSPQVTSGLTVDQLTEGLADGVWEVTDEVQGPGESTWTAFENHPRFAELAEDIEPTPSAVHSEHTSLDMNPLIDVCLVLLIFFILTTSYAAVQKYLQSPTAKAGKVTGPAVKTKQQLKEQTIKVTAQMENGKPVIRVEEDVVLEDDLTGRLQAFMKKTTKTIMSLDIANDVPHETYIAIRDAASGAGIQNIWFVVDYLPAKQS